MRKDNLVYVLFAFVFLVVSLTACIPSDRFVHNTYDNYYDDTQFDETAPIVQISQIVSPESTIYENPKTQIGDSASSDEPCFDSEYLEVIKAYRDVLLGERFILSKDYERNTLEVIGRYDAKFAIFDLSGDGIPELILDSTLCLAYEDGNDVSYWASPAPLILAYENGEVYIWFYGGGNLAHIEILDKKMILVYGRSADNSKMEYSYSKLDASGDIAHVFSCSMPVDIALHIEGHGSADGAFTVNGSFVSQEEFEESSAPFFAIGYGMVGWTNLESWINDMSNGSQIILR